jgi:hypothetical protein
MEAPAKEGEESKVLMQKRTNGEGEAFGPMDVLRGG